MQIKIADPQFQPVTIVLETQDELDQFQSILHAVSNNVIHYRPQIMNAARIMREQLHQRLVDERTTS